MKKNKKNSLNFKQNPPHSWARKWDEGLALRLIEFFLLLLLFYNKGGLNPSGLNEMIEASHLNRGQTKKTTHSKSDHESLGGDSVLGLWAAWLVDESHAAPARLATCKAGTACRPVWCHLSADEMPPPPPQMKAPSEPAGQILSLEADQFMWPSHDSGFCFIKPGGRQ